jgi:hypothetical protein
MGVQVSRGVPRACVRVSLSPNHYLNPPAMNWNAGHTANAYSRIDKIVISN